jgi:tRNA (adenine57-N1/adenine58-N1)-methyltransferase
MADTPFREGEAVLLYDDRGKHYLLALDAGKQFNSDRGVIPHNDIIGLGDGSTVESSKGARTLVLRPRLADYVLRMKRGAAVMYPKDYSAMITWADVTPGDRVLEAGTGSGAMTLALCRAVGPSGEVVTVERREDHQIHAKRLIEGFAGELPGNLVFEVGDVADHVAAVRPDRIILDLPEPWSVVGPAVDGLRGGGSFAAYLPTVPQVQTLREAMDDARVFVEVDTFEVLMRSWAVSGRSVRPEHRMVGHTGFITVGRRRR